MREQHEHDDELMSNTNVIGQFFIRKSDIQQNNYENLKKI